MASGIENVRKVIFSTEDGTTTLIDLTADTVTRGTLAKGFTAHDADGAIITGVLNPSTGVMEVTQLNGKISPVKSISGKIKAKTRLLNGKVSSAIKIGGIVSPKTILNGNIAPTKRLYGKLELIKTETSASDIPLYMGAYDVTPSAESEQVLQTAQKRMNANVKVHKIPVYEVSNNSGGTTVYIGNEV